MRVINLSIMDIDIISMALIDNAIIGKLSRAECNMVWSILENIYQTNRFSKSDLILICNSLYRYATRYDHEKLETNECKRVYNNRMESCSNE